jgi:hypothetical protein
MSSTQAIPDLRARWAQQELRVRAFELAAEILIRAGVPIIPVKGIALARWLYADVIERPMTDVDLFVPRNAWTTACRALAAGREVLYDSSELRELTVRVEGVSVELHGEVGRRELTRLSVDEMIARSTLDTESFRFPVLRLDDIDHLVLVVCNAIKDGFVFAQPHVPGDLERLLERTSSRMPILLERVREAGIGTGLYCTAEWMVEEHGSVSWRGLQQRLGLPPRPGHVRLIRAFRRSRRPTWAVAVVLGCLTNDVAALRWRATLRIAVRNAVKLVGRTPP